LAQNRQDIEPASPLEILGAFLGYFAVAKDVPATLRTLGISKLAPDQVKLWLLRCNSNPDFWLLLAVTLPLVGFLLGVSLYGTFKRPLHWAPAPSCSAFIDRLTFKDGRGKEVQYKNDYSEIIVRTHPADTSTYGQASDVRMPPWAEIKVLFVGSNYFPYWWLRHCLKSLC